MTCPMGFKLEMGNILRKFMPIIMPQRFWIWCDLTILMILWLVPGLRNEAIKFLFTWYASGSAVFFIHSVGAPLKGIVSCLIEICKSFQQVRVANSSIFKPCKPISSKMHCDTWNPISYITQRKQCTFP